MVWWLEWLILLFAVAIFVRYSESLLDLLRICAHAEGDNFCLLFRRQNYREHSPKDQDCCYFYKRGLIR